MCRQCDEFEPAIVAESLRGNPILSLPRQIAMAKRAGALRRVSLEDENASRYQCTACLRLFRLTGDYSKPTGWYIEDSP
jgi:hypothetical protein